MVVTAFIISGGSNNGKTIYFHMLFSFWLPERAVFQMKQYTSTSRRVSEWQLEEAQAFRAKKEQSLALSTLKLVIKRLEASCSDVHLFC